MKQIMKVFVIPIDRIPGGPPEAAREVEITAGSLDEIRSVARQRLTEQGHRLRAMSSSSTGLISYVEESK